MPAAAWSAFWTGKIGLHPSTAYTGLHYKSNSLPLMGKLIFAAKISKELSDQNAEITSLFFASRQIAQLMDEWAIFQSVSNQLHGSLWKLESPDSNSWCPHYSPDQADQGLG